LRLPGILSGLAALVIAVTSTLVIIYQLQPPPCSLSGKVFDADSRRPMPGAWISLYRHMEGGIRGRPELLKKNVTKTDPTGTFIADCRRIEDSQFPLQLSVSRSDWTGAFEPAQTIHHRGEWRGINIPVPRDLAPPEVTVTFAVTKIGDEALVT